MGRAKMSYNNNNNRGQVPLSPLFAPSKLRFDEHAMNDNIFQTPRNKNQENKAPPTPLSDAKDDQYKQWLQRNGFYQIFRHPSQLSAVIKILRTYSQEIYGKVQTVLQKNNEI